MESPGKGMLSLKLLFGNTVITQLKVCKENTGLWETDKTKNIELYVTGKKKL